MWQKGTFAFSASRHDSGSLSLLQPGCWIQLSWNRLLDLVKLTKGGTRFRGCGFWQDEDLDLEELEEEVDEEMQKLRQWLALSEWWAQAPYPKATSFGRLPFDGKLNENRLARVNIFVSICIICLHVHAKRPPSPFGRPFSL